MSLHPALVHLPIALILLMPPVLLIMTLAISRELISQKAWVVPSLLSLFLSASIYAAMYTGSHDRTKLESRVAASVLDAHEQSAESLFLASLGSFLFGVMAIKGGNARVFRVLYIGSIFLLAGLAMKTAQRGAAIVYGIDMPTRSEE